MSPRYVKVNVADELPRLLDLLEQGGCFYLRLTPRSVVKIGTANLRKFFKLIPAVKEMVVARFPDYAARETRDRKQLEEIERECAEAEQRKEKERRSAIARKGLATRKANAAKKTVS